MSANEEIGESHARIVYNGSATRINDIGLQVYPVSKYDSGEGLPYAPVDWPNVGVKWGWQVGKRVTSSGTFIDRYLYLRRIPRLQKVERKLDDSFEAVAKLNRLVSTGLFDMKERTTSSGTKLQSLLSYSPIRVITCKAGNKISSSLTTTNSFPAISCDISCSDPGFCRDCCCILCCKTISSDYDVNIYIRCESIVDGYICVHVSHLDCALRAYMAGTVRGSINLDAQYLCRYCNSRMDLVPHALKLLNICTSVASRADIEKILNFGI
ncbi:hypothetical protein EJD97_023328 [Solanum chilense]|uniref:Uncharacterized protein n=1 Tax=Solanum chilense TaxID=4083 RepID=A0A6N2CAC5_SOLCI|nr:hypothetical protein EJD97_023328 [Solanum chilense]